MDAKTTDGSVLGRTPLAIIAAARRMFSRHGYRRTSIVDIAREAGVSKTTIYLHYKGKEDVLLAMHAYAVSEMHRLCDIAFETNAAFPGKLLAIMQARFAPTIYDEFNAEVFVDMLPAWNQVGGNLWRPDKQAFIERLASWLRSCAATGEISLRGPKLSGEQIARAMNRSIIGARLDENIRTRADFEDHLVAVVRLTAGALQAPR